MEQNRTSYLWEDSEFTYGVGLVFTFCIVNVLLLIDMGIGALVTAITSNYVIAYVVAIVFHLTVLCCVYNLLINKEGNKLTDIEPPIGIAQKLSFVFLSVLIPPLFFVYIATWVKRHFWRKHNSPLYSEIRKARKLFRQVQKQPNTESQQQALEEAKKTYLYLLNLENSDTDINLMFIDEARKQRETIELATILRAESLAELDKVDKTMPKSVSNLD